ncbi:VCBS repeat-containing protein, partial [Candidatus Poribacteria bacterium]|nr:VCBS repeat-containing protein [Candidatus Poribacteria bacterium]
MGLLVQRFIETRIQDSGFRACSDPSEIQDSEPALSATKGFICIPALRDFASLNLHLVSGILITHYASRVTHHVSRFTFHAWLSGFLVFVTITPSWGWVRFTDVTEEAGIRFVHINGATGEHLFPETIGSGCAFFDYDHDDWLDIYLVNGGDFRREGEAPTEPTRGVSNALYRNNGDGTFTDVTQAAGVGETGFGAGVCVGDYNGDGWEDLYICNYGRNTLYRNNGDGTFTDVTQTAGVGEGRWSTSSAFFDADNDSDLDLYVANYVRYATVRDGCVFHVPPRSVIGGGSETPRRENSATRELRVYCGPENFDPETDTLYRNNGDGTFTDVSKAAGITPSDSPLPLGEGPGVRSGAGRGLGVICGDYDDDGDTDIFVANDMSPNLLYRNRGDGTFEEVGFRAGIALSEDATLGNGMGIDLADFDNDGGLDLIVTNFQDQVNTLYHNDRDGFFTDVSYSSGTGVPSLPFLGWGCGLVDVDNDGWRDLFIVNGHIHDNIEQFNDVGKYAQPKQLFRNENRGIFSDMSAQSGAALTIPQVSRGAAFGDYDNDG